MNLPKDLTEPALAEWLHREYYGPPGTVPQLWPRLDGLAHSVRALVEAKVREALLPYLSVGFTDDGRVEYDIPAMDKEIARVMGASS